VLEQACGAHTQAFGRIQASDPSHPLHHTICTRQKTQKISQREQLKHRLQLVVAIRATSGDLQEPVDLGRGRPPARSGVGINPSGVALATHVALQVAPQIVHQTAIHTVIARLGARMRGVVAFGQPLHPITAALVFGIQSLRSRLAGSRRGAAMNRSQSRT